MQASSLSRVYIDSLDKTKPHACRLCGYIRNSKNTFPNGNEHAECYNGLLTHLVAVTLKFTMCLHYH